VLWAIVALVAAIALNYTGGRIGLGAVIGTAAVSLVRLWSWWPR
jgi:hypothetical protein